MLCKKGVLKIFAKFTGKQLCHSLFFNKKIACKFVSKETLAKKQSPKKNDSEKLLSANMTTKTLNIMKEMIEKIKRKSSNLARKMSINEADIFDYLKWF